MYMVVVVVVVVGRVSLAHRCDSLRDATLASVDDFSCKLRSVRGESLVEVRQRCVSHKQKNYLFICPAR